MKLTVTSNEAKAVIPITESQTILEVLTEYGIPVFACCGGNGTCGKCAVRVTSGVVPATANDRAFFSFQQLKEGWRLSCSAKVTEDAVISLSFPFFPAVAITSCQPNDAPPPASFCSIGIDLGTTTVALELVNLSDGAPVDTVCLPNEQQLYGSDVISRIAAAAGGKQQKLYACARRTLIRGIHLLLGRCGVSGAHVKKVVLAGNTTMIHLLMGYPCSTLGVAPFTPINLGPIEKPFEELLRDDTLSCPVFIAPGISTFVGGDIVSGLYAVDADQSNSPFLFIDLGTNCEMAVSNGSSLFVASAAAGPAFEGGNLSHGVGGIDGAICTVTIRNRRARCTTIQNGDPIGICGSGALETVADLRRENLLDESGRLSEEYRKNGFILSQNSKKGNILFTQKDVREMQLAKAAVRAGIDTLLLRSGIDTGVLATVFLAGSFGAHLNAGKAAGIGMLPHDLLQKTHPVGNTSLRGACKALGDAGAYERMIRIARDAKEVPLSRDEDFQRFFVEGMGF